MSGTVAARRVSSLSLPCVAARLAPSSCAIVRRSLADKKINHFQANAERELLSRLVLSGSLVVVVVGLFARLLRTNLHLIAIADSFGSRKQAARASGSLHFSSNLVQAEEGAFVFHRRLRWLCTRERPLIKAKQRGALLKTSERIVVAQQSARRCLVADSFGLSKTNFELPRGALLYARARARKDELRAAIFSSREVNNERARVFKAARKVEHLFNFRRETRRELLNKSLPRRKWFMQMR